MANQTIKYKYYVEGMHCSACELLLEKKLSKVDGVKKVDAILAEDTINILSEKELNISELNKLIVEDGYRINETKKDKSSINFKELGLAFLITAFMVTIFIGIQRAGVVNLLNTDEITLPFVFFIGFVASISSCMAVVGGLVLSISSNYAMEKKTKPLMIFHISRLIGFFILGGLIGLLGSAFILTNTVSFILSIILFFVMLVLGINLLDIFAFLKKFQIKMPKSLGRLAIKMEGSNNSYAPILLGLVTFVLPCGFTQSMQIYSLTTGSFLNGAVIMFVFALGTLPVLALISIASVKFSKTLQSGLFFKTAGFLVIFFALFNFTSALVALGLIEPFLNI